MFLFPLTTLWQTCHIPSCHWQSLMRLLPVYCAVTPDALWFCASSRRHGKSRAFGSILIRSVTWPAAQTTFVCFFVRVSATCSCSPISWPCCLLLLLYVTGLVLQRCTPDTRYCTSTTSEYQLREEERWEMKWQMANWLQNLKRSGFCYSTHQVIQVGFKMQKSFFYKRQMFLSRLKVIIESSFKSHTALWICVWFRALRPNG